MSVLQAYDHLELDRCPHCNVATPLLQRIYGFRTDNHSNTRHREWSVYVCKTCGGVVIAAVVSGQGANISEIIPSVRTIDSAIPDRARSYLSQAISSLHAPAGAVMLAASAVDSMLKEKGYRQGTLFSRIDKAAADHLITEDMAAWAHEVRLEANDQRHADDSAPLPEEADAQRVIDFASALAEFLFVLPERVARGRQATQ